MSDGHTHQASIRRDDHRRPFGSASEAAFEATMRNLKIRLIHNNGAGQSIVGYLEALAAYGPAASEQFKITLGVEV